MQMLDGFEAFKANVREKGGIWTSDNVHFTKYMDGYSATYQPEFPYHSRDDCAIIYSWVKDEWSYMTPEIYDVEYNKIFEDDRNTEAGT